MTIDEITSQEELDAALDAAREEGRKARESEVRAEYADYDDLKQKAGQLAETQATVAALERDKAALEHNQLRTNIAMEAGLPYAMASRLRGDTEEALREDAAALKKLMGAGRAAPLASPETPAEGGKRARLKGLRDSLLED